MESRTEKLFEAIKSKNTAQIKKLIAEGGLDLAAKKNGITVIEYASIMKEYSSDHIKIIANAIKSDENDTYNYGSALLTSIKKKDRETAECLLKAGAKGTWVTTSDQNTSLHWAVKNDDAEMVKLLLRYSIHEAVNKAGQSPLELAFSLKHWKCADALFQSKSFHHSSTKLGELFIEAICAGELEIAKQLLNHDASTTEVGKNKNTSLHCAIQQWHESSQKLLDKVLSYQPQKHIQMIKFLLEKTNSQDAVNMEDETPIELACKLGLWDCTQLLLEDEKVKLVKGKTSRINALHLEKALEHTIQQGNYAIAKLLLEHHAPFNRCNSDMGNVALYLALKHPRILTLLLSHGADPRVENKDAKDTLALAKDLNYTESYELLKKICSPEINTISKSTVNPIKQKNNSFEEIQKYRTMAYSLYQDICANQYTPENLPNAVRELLSYHQFIFEGDTANLQAQRKTLRNENLANQTQLDEMTLLISTINLLLIQPNTAISEDVLKLNLNEAHDIKNYIICKSHINNYQTRLKNYLVGLNNRIYAKTWQVKNFSRKWAPGDPRHIQKIKAALENFQYLTAFASTYATVAKIFISLPDSDDRHPDVKEFDTKEKDAIKLLTFIPAKYINLTTINYTSTLAHNDDTPPLITNATTPILLTWDSLPWPNSYISPIASTPQPTTYLQAPYQTYLQPSLVTIEPPNWEAAYYIVSPQDLTYQGYPQYPYYQESVQAQPLLPELPLGFEEKKAATKSPLQTLGLYAQNLNQLPAPTNPTNEPEHHLRHSHH